MPIKTVRAPADDKAVERCGKCGLPFKKGDAREMSTTDDAWKHAICPAIPATVTPEGKPKRKPGRPKKPIEKFN